MALNLNLRRGGSLQCYCHHALQASTSGLHTSPSCPTPQGTSRGLSHCTRLSFSLSPNTSPTFPDVTISAPHHDRPCEQSVLIPRMYSAGSFLADTVLWSHGWNTPPFPSLRLSHSTIDIWSQMILDCQVCAAHQRKLRGIPGLAPWDVSSNLPVPSM